MNDEGIRTTSLPPRSDSPVCVQWLNDQSMIRNSDHEVKGTTSPIARERYQQMMRARHTILTAARPTVEAFMAIFPNVGGAASSQSLRRTVPEIILSTRGEILALCFKSWGILAIDLRSTSARGREEYIIRIEWIKFSNSICVEPFQYHDQDGFVLVYRIRHKVNVVFQPFHAVEARLGSVTPSVLVATLQLNRKAAMKFAKVSGHWLGFVEHEDTEEETVYISVINMTTGERWGTDWVSRQGLPTDLEVVNNEYVTVSMDRFPRHFRLLPGGAMRGIYPEQDFSLSAPILAPQSLSIDHVTGQPFFGDWYEADDGVWYAETELHSPPYENNTTSHSRPIKLPPTLRVGKSFKKPIHSTVFDWSMVAQDNGGARYCFSLINFLAMEEDGDFVPTSKRANVVLTRVSGGTGNDGERKLEHELLWVRQQRTTSEPKGVTQNLGTFHSRSEGAGRLRPLLISSDDTLIRWNTVAGILVVRGKFAGGYRIMVYRFVTDS
ncbi:hypothetical protein DL93DRAFT_2099274 [Clavulina sp. PMI_390]|nr:hypothetical protein DL93DRAFT_2099274 [Clavulina sp. PMI_390]